MPELFIVLRRDIPGLDPSVTGRMLSEREPLLARLARKLNVVPLMEFASQDPAEGAALLAEMGVDPTEIELPEEAWFSSHQGLETVQVLSEYLQTHPATMPDTDRILEELAEWEKVLSRAVEEKIPWHLAVDY
ncbi:hypothetical protein DTL42_17310 [Bremerella cremea]|uniref:Uncharacterized protein n=1 Tax=Bremerella cremea TaxID=1031537 RepID=A0A368KQH1_9BACT|nr:hypothetical protein [Bremerella cremea]RCS44680.1 hypothetical protein DTL42_17310 [Bremerella cremea]